MSQAEISPILKIPDLLDNLYCLLCSYLPRFNLTSRAGLILGKPTLTAGTQNRLDGVQRTHLPQMRGATPRQRLPLRLRSAWQQTTYHGFSPCRFSPLKIAEELRLVLLRGKIEAKQDNHYNENELTYYYDFSRYLRYVKTKNK